MLFLAVIDCSIAWFAIQVTRGQNVVYGESVGVVTSGNVTKMAVTPFDPPLLETPCMLHANFAALSSIIVKKT